MCYICCCRGSESSQMSETLYLNKKDEVFERCVEVGLLLQLHDGVKVLVVDVGVDPEQTLQNGLRHRHKVTLKGHTLGTRERSWWENHLSSGCSYITVCCPTLQRSLQADHSMNFVFTVSNLLLSILPMWLFMLQVCSAVLLWLTELLWSTEAWWEASTEPPTVQLNMHQSRVKTSGQLNKSHYMLDIWMQATESWIDFNKCARVLYHNTCLTRCSNLEDFERLRQALRSFLAKWTIDLLIVDNEVNSVPPGQHIYHFHWHVLGPSDFHLRWLPSN